MIGRDAELARLRRLIAESRDGRGNAIVVTGEAGIGKSALFAELEATTADTRILRVTGLESEAELPFAALHLLLRPVSPLVDALPQAQRAALRTAFGQETGAGAERFLVGLATLTLIADLAEEKPVLCLVDDAQWLDRASADALVFAARRLDADRITMILAVRDDGADSPIPGLAQLRLSGLDPADSRRLLSVVVDGPVPEVRERLVAESAGNPLALIEFANALTPEQKAGRLDPLPLPSPPMAGRLEQSLRDAIGPLPEATRRLLLLAATEGTGNLALVLKAADHTDPNQPASPVQSHRPTDEEPAAQAHRPAEDPSADNRLSTVAPNTGPGARHAATADSARPPADLASPGSAEVAAAVRSTGEAAADQRRRAETVAGESVLGGRDEAGGVRELAPAEAANLVRVTASRLEFRHPLVKTAAYRHAPLAQRIDAHRALAAVLDGDADADRRAWHLSAAAVGPDEATGDALRMTGDRARQLGSFASAVTAYERSAQLTVDRELRARRLTCAAESAVAAGQLHRAHSAAERAGRLTADPAATARLAAVRAAVATELGGQDPSRGTAHSDADPGTSPLPVDPSGPGFPYPYGGGAGPDGLAEPVQILIDAAAAIVGSAPTQAAVMLANAASSAWFAGDHEALRHSARLLVPLEPDIDSALIPVVHIVSGMERLLAEDPRTGLGLLSDAIGLLRHPATPAPQPTASGPALSASGPVVATFGVFGALMSGDVAAACELAAAWVSDCRRRGLIGTLPHALQLLTQAQALRGWHLRAAASGAEAWRIAEDTGQFGRLRQLGGILAWLSAIRGEDEECLRLARLAEGEMRERHGSGWGACSLGLLDLVRGRPEAVAERMTRILDGPLGHTVIVTIAIPDHVEACVRLGEPERARSAFARFDAWANAGSQEWALAVARRCRAQLGPSPQAEEHFRGAMGHHVHGGRDFEHARTRLLYGEWLRRQRRRADAREQLSVAVSEFDELGAKPWAARARAELAATGGTVTSSRQDSALGTLTRRELDVVRLAATGATNRQIAAQLFLSPRTVGYHLYKAYPKLGITARTELSGLDFG